MKTTIKSVNKAMPRVDVLRRDYMLPGESGIAHGNGILDKALAETDADGIVTITLYAIGEAKPAAHYYESETVDVTTEISEFINGEYGRDFTCRRIAEMLNGAN